MSATQTIYLLLKVVKNICLKILEYRLGSSQTLFENHTWGQAIVIVADATKLFSKEKQHPN